MAVCVAYVDWLIMDTDLARIRVQGKNILLLPVFFQTPLYVCTAPRLSFTTTSMVTGFGSTSMRSSYPSLPWLILPQPALAHPFPACLGSFCPGSSCPSLPWLVLPWLILPQPALARSALAYPVPACPGSFCPGLSCPSLT